MKFNVASYAASDESFKELGVEDPAGESEWAGKVAVNKRLLLSSVRRVIVPIVISKTNCSLDLGMDLIVAE